MNRFHSSQQLSAQADRCADSEAAFWLATTKFSKIASLQVHHYVVEFLIAATADESTNVVLTYSHTTSSIGWPIKTSQISALNYKTLKLRGKSN